MRSKLISATSTGNLFDSNSKRNTSKVIYRNPSRRNVSEKSLKEGASIDSIQTKNDNNKKNSSSNNNVNMSEYMINCVNKSKIITKNTSAQSGKN